MTKKGTPHSQKFQHYWNLTISLLSVIFRTLVGGGVLLLCREAVGVFYSPNQQSNNKGLTDQDGCIHKSTEKQFIQSEPKTDKYFSLQHKENRWAFFSFGHFQIELQKGLIGRMWKPGSWPSLGYDHVWVSCTACVYVERLWYVRVQYESWKFAWGSHNRIKLFRKGLYAASTTVYKCLWSQCVTCSCVQDYFVVSVNKLWNWEWLSEVTGCAA